tara:strand:+ start:154 stop:567 length:414 start_codon:yes stop_codon:yes gene_type:complete
MPVKKILTIFFSLLTLQGCSLINSVSNFRKDYSCDGKIQTMIFTLPTNFKVSNEYLTMKYIGDIDMLKDLEESYQFDLSYANGVLVSRINSNEISFSALGIDGTLLLKECELQLPLEQELSKNFLKLLPYILSIYGG